MPRAQRDAFVARYKSVTITWGPLANRESRLTFSSVNDDGDQKEIEIDGSDEILAKIKGGAKSTGNAISLAADGGGQTEAASSGGSPNG